MKFSQFLIPTMVNNPSDCDNNSQRLMLRTGMIKKVSNGLYFYLPSFMRVMEKVTRVINEEMQNIGCNHVKFPILVSKDLLDMSGRWNAFGKEMFKLQDRNDKLYAISPTNEEYACLLAQNFVTSYKDLPFAIYQIQQKHRDEIRPRGGVMRAREFIMKDAYSFHDSDENLSDFYNKVKNAYMTIFKRLGLNVVAVNADSGAMGGEQSQEFMSICETGDADIAICEDCGFVANLETVSCLKPLQQPFTLQYLKPEKIHTPNIKTIDELLNFLKIDIKNFVKSIIFKTDDSYVMALVRGDREVNDVKLAKYLKVKNIELASEEEIKKNFNTEIGFIGPLLQNIKIYADYEVENMQYFVVGANEKDFHLKNVSCRDFKAEFIDLRCAEQGDCCPVCGKPLKLVKGNELGHVFKLGKHYTEKLNITFVNKDGKNQTMTMGCYGIGVERTISAIIEQFADEKGIAWPVSSAPFVVNLITVDIKNQEQKQASEEIYNKLLNAGIDVLWDDREERVGFKFKDSELIGFPLNIIIGKNILNNQVEFQPRLAEKQIIDVKDILYNVREFLNKN